MIKWLLAVILSISIAMLGISATLKQQVFPNGDKVRHELITLPYYGVFDIIKFEVAGNTVILSGFVVKPLTKYDAENRVSSVPGVDNVINNIEVLPISAFDSRTRQREYHALFSNSSLFKYSLGAVPSIHIIVKNGNVTLEGYVDNEFDRNYATLKANLVAGVFSVTNNLVVSK
jgi:hyperosmotically inducible periplasmic protein